MNGTTDQWYLSGTLGIGTTFQEPTDAQSRLSVSWEDAGSAIRHTKPNALNLLDGRPAAVDQGLNLSWWGLNATGNATRLGLITSRFAATAEGSAAGYLGFYTKAPDGDVTERMRIDSGGNVGIGTGAPRRRLDVLGDIVATNRLTVAQDAGVATRTWHLDNAAGRFRIFDQPNINTSGTERLTITADGNVGIGTPTPVTGTGGRALHVHNSSGPSALRLGHGGPNGQQWEWQSTVIGSNGAMNLSNLTNLTNPLTILGNGNVGIGTTTPTVRCAINGTFTIIGSVRDDPARQILSTLPSYSVIIGVEDISQGAALVFYWKDGSGQRRKGWVSGMIF